MLSPDSVVACHDNLIIFIPVQKHVFGAKGIKWVCNSAGIFNRTLSVALVININLS